MLLLKLSSTLKCLSRWCLDDYTEPGLRGDTATNTLKDAVLETGAKIRVPLFIETGELVEVDTRDGSYQNRVKA